MGQDGEANELGRTDGANDRHNFGDAIPNRTATSCSDWLDVGRAPFDC